MCLLFNRPSKSNVSNITQVALLLLLLILCPNAFAGEWSFKPSLELEETYSDNISLSAEGEEQDEFITEVNPRLSVSGEGSRVKLNANYRMQNIFYAERSSRNRTFHQLSGNGNAVLVKDFLFIDGNTNVSQQLVSADDQVAFDNLSVTENRTDKVSYNVSPYLQYTMGSIAATVIRYAYDRIIYSNSSADNRTRSYTATVQNGPSFKRINWNMKYHKQETLFDAGRDVTFEKINGTIGYYVTPTLNIFGSGGYDNNNFRSIRGKTGGVTWNAGGTWAPGPRTSLSGAYGERFFGDYFTVSFEHKTRHMSWQAKYNETTQTIRDIEFREQGVIIVSPSGELAIADVTVPTLTTEVFLSKRAQLGISRKHNKVSLALNLFAERREFQSSGDNEDLFGGSSRLSFHLGPKTALNIHGSWQRRGFRDSERENDLWVASMGASRKFGQHINCSIRYRISGRESDVSRREYLENRVSARLTFHL